MVVARILATKGHAVVTALTTDTVLTIARKLTDHKIGAVVICQADNVIEGIVSERDVVRAISKDGPMALSRTAASVMTTNVKTCKAGDSEADLMVLMTTHRIRHLPVANNGKLVGMISIGDVVKHRIEAIEQESEHMKAYIATAG
jgi:CBS domain-containing protein